MTTPMNNNAAANTVKEEKTMTKNVINNIRVAGATPFTMAGAAMAFGAECCRAIAEKIGGDQVERAPGYNYLAAHTTGHISKKARADVIEAARDAAEKAAAEKDGLSKYVRWDDKNGRYVSSKFAWDKAKAEGKERPFMPSIYKAANWLINSVSEGLEKVKTFKVTKDGRVTEVTHTNAGWVYHHLHGHASWLEGKGAKYALTPEGMKRFFEQAVKLAKLGDKAPSWEDFLKVVQAEAVPAERPKTEITKPAADAKEQPKAKAEVKAETKAEVKEEARDGRAPKQAGRKLNELIHVLGFARLKADNAGEVAEKAMAAYAAVELTEEEFRSVIDACVKKDGDNADFYNGLTA